jgi:RHS repeat-associated protein
VYFCNDANTCSPAAGRRVNVTALVNTSGSVVERYYYDPYGKVTICNSSWGGIAWPNSKKNEILYCGYRYDWETGLCHVRRRHYHPTLGRRLQRHPGSSNVTRDSNGRTGQWAACRRPAGRRFGLPSDPAEGQ